jgi:hypothetical protein
MNPVIVAKFLRTLAIFLQGIIRDNPAGDAYRQARRCGSARPSLSRQAGRFGVAAGWRRTT